MNNCCTSRDDDTAEAKYASALLACASQEQRAHSPWLGRAALCLKWAIPVTVLAIIPKCPVCIAGYVLLFTGMSLSVSVVAGVRWGLIALSVLAIAWLIIRVLRRTLSRGAHDRHRIQRVMW